MMKVSHCYSEKKFSNSLLSVHMATLEVQYNTSAMIHSYHGWIQQGKGKGEGKLHIISGRVVNHL